MAKTPSAMVPLGMQAPSFSLIDVISNQRFRLEDGQGSTATVIFFICNHCPYVKHVIDELPKLARDYHKKGVQCIAINANDVSQYPEDSPENMKKMALEKQFPFVYLFDETQEVAKAYEAQCTPDFYVFDHDLKLVYRGQLDHARPGNDTPVTGKCIREALDNLLSHQPINTQQLPSMGCNIKWR